MASEQGYPLRQFAPFFQGNHSKGTSTAGFPVDGQIMGVCLEKEREVVSSLRRCRRGSVSGAGRRGRKGRANLDQIGVPGISRDAQVIVALILDPL